MNLLPNNLKKSQIKQLKMILFSLGLLLVFLVILLLTPQAVQLTESKINQSFNQPWDKPQYLVYQVAGSEKKQPQIVSKNIPAPSFGSGAVIAIDFETGQVLYEKNINQRLFPASTTKIMTALVAVDHYTSGDFLTVPAEAKVGGSSMGLQVGERLSFRSLLYGMLLNSGNDAAYTLALNYPGGLEAFVAQMNQRALDLGLKNTHFDNPAGFDGANHYSSAYDLAVIAKQAAIHPQLAKVVATKDTSIITMDKKNHTLHNLNQLLDIDGVIGIKTGTTELAGENFVGLVDRNGHKVITVVLKSTDRFKESKSLMDWVYANYTWE